MRKHGHYINGRPTPTLNSWGHMWGRSKGGVCGRWRDFLNFLEDMGERPEGMVLGRLAPDLTYSKENCAWMSWSEVQLRIRNRSYESSDSV